MEDKALEYIERLTASGFVADYARRVVERCFVTLGPDGAEQYIRFVERLMDDKREYPKEG